MEGVSQSKKMIYRLFSEGENILFLNPAGEKLLYTSLDGDVSAALQAVINSASSDTTIYISPGTYYLETPVRISNKTNITLQGGEGVTLNGNGIIVLNTSGLRIEGITFLNSKDHGVYFSATKTTSNIFVNSCEVIDPAGFGVMFYGDGVSYFKNVALFNCSVTGAGRAENRTNNYACGFDLCDNCNMETVFVANCEASYCWESGFHMEAAAVKKGVVYLSCESYNNGMKQVEGKEPADYGCGFLCSGGAVYEKCTARDNIVDYRDCDEVGGVLIDCNAKI